MTLKIHEALKFHYDSIKPMTLKNSKFITHIILNKSEIALGFCAILTLVIILIRPHLIIIDEMPVNHRYSGIRTDQGHPSNKGKSEGSFINNDEMHFKCTIVKSSYSSPYCGLALVLGRGLHSGIDLSQYESIILDIDYTGDAKTARFYLRNYSEAYFDYQDNASTKYHIIEFETALLNKPFEVKLADFKVADWWVAKFNIPFAMSNNEFTNIVIAQIQTGTNTPSGEQTFKINSIQLKKKRISDENFNLFLSIFWLAISFGILIFKIIIKNIALKKETQKTQELNNEKTHFIIKAHTDNLTKILNRHGIEKNITTTLDNLTDPICLSVIFFDLDHFKNLNDTYGHDFGDSVLVEVAQLVQNNIRESDQFARWGGEEFVILCKETYNKDAVALANKLCQLIAAHTFNNGINVTASFGVSTNKILTKEEIDKTIKNADEALYNAKHSGRNNVKNHNKML